MSGNCKHDSWWSSLGITTTGNKIYHKMQCEICGIIKDIELLVHEGNINMNKGTPKTLVEAIQNGVERARMDDVLSPKLQAELIQKHVRDFLSQKFGIAYLSSKHGTDEFSYLWEAITGEKNLP